MTTKFLPQAVKPVFYLLISRSDFSKKIQINPFIVPVYAELLHVEEIKSK